MQLADFTDETTHVVQRRLEVLWSQLESAGLRAAELFFIDFIWICLECPPPFFFDLS
jgi:hypothetical protein